MIKVLIPFSEAIGTGTFSGLLKDLVTVNNTVLKTSVDSNNMVVISGINPYNKLTQSILNVDLAKQIVSIGGEVYGMPVFFKMKKDYATTTPVPSEFPNSTKNIDDVQTNVNWYDWHDSTHTVNEYDNNGIIEVVVPGNSFGEELPASIWTNVSQDNVDILSISDYTEYISNFIDTPTV